MGFRNCNREKRLNNLQFLWNFMIDLFIVSVNVYDFPEHFRYGKVVWVFFGWCNYFPMAWELFKCFQDKSEFFRMSHKTFSSVVKFSTSPNHAVYTHLMECKLVHTQHVNLKFLFPSHLHIGLNRDTFKHIFLPDIIIFYHAVFYSNGKNLKLPSEA